MAKIQIVKQFDINVDQLNEVEKAAYTALEHETVKRDYFVPGFIYGGPKATVAGKFIGKRYKMTITTDGTPETKFVWGVVFAQSTGKDADGNEIFRDCDSISQSFLLPKSRFDSNNNLIPMLGNVREWAQSHITANKLKSEWTKELADELNKRGLKVEVREYQALRKDGGTFTGTIYDPYFAE